MTEDEKSSRRIGDACRAVCNAVKHYVVQLSAVETEDVYSYITEDLQYTLHRIIREKRTSEAK